MESIGQVLSYFLDLRFVLMVLIGAVSGLFVGAIPGLSVSMATALLVSVSYTWAPQDALASIMGIYVVGVFSGAISAILINIPGAPSSVVTTLDGNPLAKQGRAYEALKYAAFYSFFGSLMGLLMLWGLAAPLSQIALKFQPMDYFLLCLFGLITVGSLSAKSFTKAMLSAGFGLIISMVGMDSVVGTPRLTFGIQELIAGIGVVPVLVGLFGFSEIIYALSNKNKDENIQKIEKNKVKTSEIIKHFPHSIYYGLIGALVGILPGAGGPIASFLAYGAARKTVKKPSAPFGEGAVEGIVASETANNALIGGALIPMLTLAVPGDAVTAIILSVFYVHGLRPGPMFIRQSPEIFSSIIASGLIASFMLLLLGLFIAPKISKVLLIPKRLLLPIVFILCVLGAYASNNRLFDVLLMLIFGLIGFFMRKHDYPLAPMTLAIVLGSMMDSNFRRAVSLAISEENVLFAMFNRPLSLALLALVIFSLVRHLAVFRRNKK